jgi:hypothetical protein
MKKNSAFLILCIIALTFGANAQLKVNSTGKVGIGIDPDATYNLSMNSAIFKSGYTYPNLIITADPTNAPYGRAILPSSNNTCKLGYSGQAFNGIWTYSLTNLSDGRQKENIKEIKNALEIVMKLKGVKYDLKKEFTYSTAEIKDEKILTRLEAQRKNKVGFIAQDVNVVLPEVVQYDDSTDIYGINYAEIVPVLVEAIKEQQARIDELKSLVLNCCQTNLKSGAVTTPTTETKLENAARLDQNIPNPFSRETRIGCFIPKGSTSSVLYVYNMNGAQLQQYNISGKGQQIVTINSNSLEPGMYLYALVVDGKEVDTKRMILTK